MSVIDKLLGLKEQGVATLVPEMAWERWAGEIRASPVEDAIESKGVAVRAAAERPKDFKQSDKRWRKKMYSSVNNPGQTMGSSGCGPTAMADVLATFGVDITPWGVAKLFMAKGFRTKSDGTAWGAFKWCFKHWPDVFAKYAQTKNFASAKKALDQGALIVCNMGPGYWTKGGHYICVWKVEDGYVYACDPASKVRKRQKVGPFKAQCKAMFIFKRAGS